MLQGNTGMLAILRLVRAVCSVLELGRWGRCCGWRARGESHQGVCVGLACLSGILDGGGVV